MGKTLGTSIWDVGSGGSSSGGNVQMNVTRVGQSPAVHRAAVASNQRQRNDKKDVDEVSNAPSKASSKDKGGVMRSGGKRRAKSGGGGGVGQGFDRMSLDDAIAPEQPTINALKRLVKEYEERTNVPTWDEKQEYKEARIAVCLVQEQTNKDRKRDREMQDVQQTQQVCICFVCFTHHRKHKFYLYTTPILTTHFCSANFYFPIA